VKEEKHWYVNHLHFEFSATVDSLRVFRKDRGLLYFQITDGKVNKAVEGNLNRRLRYNGNLRFIFVIQNKLAMRTMDADKYAVGDSIRVITDQNSIKIYRSKTLVGKAEIARSLVGRPY
jgi:hypothetical protein